jgi:hypothetical protein
MTSGDQTTADERVPSGDAAQRAGEPASGAGSPILYPAGALLRSVMPATVGVMLVALGIVWFARPAAWWTVLVGGAAPGVGYLAPALVLRWVGIRQPAADWAMITLGNQMIACLLAATAAIALLYSAPRTAAMPGAFTAAAGFIIVSIAVAKATATAIQAAESRSG